MADVGAALAWRSRLGKAAAWVEAASSPVSKANALADLRQELCRALATDDGAVCVVAMAQTYFGELQLARNERARADVEAVGRVLDAFPGAQVLQHALTVEQAPPRGRR